MWFLLAVEGFKTVRSLAPRLCRMPASQFNSPSGSVLRPRMPELDMLRGIACLMVLFFHGFGNHYDANRLPAPLKQFVGATAYGWVGVNLFFVLSGFLITGILLDSKLKPRYYANFYWRRALRILPAYYGILVLLLMLNRIGMIDRPASWGFLGLSAVYMANLTPLFGVGASFGVLWSLAVEEHFYLLWPFCVRRVGLAGVGVLAAFIAAGALVCRIVDFSLGGDALGHYTWLVADGLAIGALLAVAARGVGRFGLRVVAIAAFAISMLGYQVDGIAGHSLSGGAIHITSINTFFAGTVMMCLLLGSKFQFRSRWLEFIGEISYGLYLIHLLCFDVFDHFAQRFWPELAARDVGFRVMLFRFFVSATVAIALATLSRRHFEERFLRLKERLPFQSLPESANDEKLVGSPSEAA